MNKRQVAPAMKIGDICPECGEAAVVNEEGCPGEVRPSATLAGLVSAKVKSSGSLNCRSEFLFSGVGFRLTLLNW